MQIRLGAEFAIQKKMKLYVGCDGLTGNESRNHGAQIQWQMKFWVGTPEMQFVRKTGCRRRHPVFL
ncbi:hypothetical protein NB639_04215 [Oxalobacter formigenes]|uniref:hypothetical protein n=1 Tax=Oxalobacter formigenes TaxID=847 RepID=UPI0022AEE294|nr:hypothetical protein [Oxalobacter formigenes]WAW06625.1 hypothetical protein NB639_04215 [Oxalobacter formigenes]